MQPRTQEAIEGDGARYSPLYRFWQRWAVPISLALVLVAVVAIANDIFLQGGPHYQIVVPWTVLALCNLVEVLKIERLKLGALTVSFLCLMYLAVAR